MEKTYTIGEVAKKINRASHTIRVWGYSHRLPQHLQPQFDERGWRVWTEDQIEGIKLWIIEEDMTPGKGLRK